MVDHDPEDARFGAVAMVRDQGALLMTGVRRELDTGCRFGMMHGFLNRSGHVHQGADRGESMPTGALLEPWSGSV